MSNSNLVVITEAEALNLAALQFDADEALRDSQAKQSLASGECIRLYDEKRKVHGDWQAYEGIRLQVRVANTARGMGIKASDKAWGRLWDGTNQQVPKSDNADSVKRQANRTKQAEAQAKVIDAALQAIGVSELNNDTAAMVAEKLNKPLDKLTPTERTLATKAIAMAEKAAAKAARDEAKAARQSDYNIVKAAIASDDEMLAACLKAVMALNKKRDAAKAAKPNPNKAVA